MYIIDNYKIDANRNNWNKSSNIHHELDDRNNDNFKNQDTFVKTNDKNHASYFKKVIVPNSDELNRHKEYLKNNLKKNYF